MQPLLFDNPKNITCLSEKSLCCNEKIDSTSPGKSNSAYILGIIPHAEEKTPPRPSWPSNQGHSSIPWGQAVTVQQFL